MAERTLTVKIVGDDADLLRAFRRSSAGAQKFSASFGTLVKGAVVFEGVRAGLQGIGRVLPAIIGGASDLGESINKNAVVFGRSAKAIDDFAKTTADSLGLSRNQALEAAAGFGAMLQTAGLAEGQSAGFSKRLVQLAADMASFNNEDPSEMLLKLRSGLAGEAEPLRRVGVLLSEARVKQQAYASGIAKAGEELTEGQKVQARYQLILKDTAKQQGDFARTSDGLANAQRRLRAGLSNVGAALGEAIVPALASATSALASALPEIQAKFAELAERISPVIERIVESIRERLPAIRDAIVPILEVLQDRLVPILQDLASIVGQVWTTIVDVFTRNAGSIREILDNLTSALGDIWKVAKPTLIFLFTKALPAALNIAIPLLAKVTLITRTMAAVFVRVAGIILSAVEKILGGFSGLAEAASHLPFVGDKFSGVADKINLVRDGLKGTLEDLNALDGQSADITVRTTYSSDFVGPIPPGATIEDPSKPGPKKPPPTPKIPPPPPVPDVTPRVTAAEKAREAFDKLMSALGLQLDRAKEETPKKFADDLRVLADMEAAVRKQIAIEGRTTELERELYDIERERLAITQQRRDVAKAQAEASRERRKAEQFLALGLTAEGEKKTPSSGALLRRARNLQEQLEDAGLGGSKSGAQLRKIVAVLKANLKTAGRDVRQAILGMLNDISGALEGGGGDASAVFTKFAKRGVEGLVKGLGLTEEQVKEIRQRFSGYSRFDMARAPGPTTSPSKSGPPTRGFSAADRERIELHIYLDGNELEGNVTKKQQKKRGRNAQQRRGVRAGL